MSVIIPTFNRAHTLPRALESVMAQTERDLEVIVVDDHSTDGTRELLRQYKGIRYVLNRHARGPAGARNQGLEEATGKYVAFLDSDDTWFSWHLEESLSCLKIFRLEASFALWYRQRGAVWERYPKEWLRILAEDLELKQVGSVIPLGKRIAEYSIAKPFWCFHVNTLVAKKQVLLQCSFDESFRSAEDLELSFRLLLKTPTGLINKYHARYYEGDDNLVALREEDQKKRRKFHRNMVKAFKRIRATMEKAPQIIDKVLCREQLSRKIEEYSDRRKP